MEVPTLTLRATDNDAFAQVVASHVMPGRSLGRTRGPELNVIFGIFMKRDRNAIIRVSK